MSEHLDPEERLAILQMADPFRKWNSLDEQRVCVLCHKLITGDEIVISVDGDGDYHLNCPSVGCAATPREWYYHGSAAAPIRPVPSATRKGEVDLSFL